MTADTSGSANSSSVNRAWPVFRSLSGYRLQFLSHDLFAGLTLAAIAIPEQMATARLGGFTPQIGFLAFLAGSLAFAVFGSNRFLSCGADSTITPIFAGGLAALAVSGSPDYLTLATALALMVGLFLFAAGLFRLGWIADLLSVPVTIGFLAGISVHILISQLPVILGLPAPDGPVLQRVAILADHLNQTNAFTLVIGLGVLAIIALSEQIDARIPGALIGLALASAAVVLLRLESRGVSVLGAVSVEMPALAVPIVSAGHLASLVSLSLIISIIIMVQTAATTRSFPSDPNEPPDVDRDFLGVGVGSVLSGLIGAFPVNASPPRTAVVSETGGRSQIAGLAAVAIVIVLLAFGASLLHQIPNAALGGVLLFVALRIIRVSQIVAIYRQSLGEFLLILLTAAAIIVLPIEQGVGIGIATVAAARHMEHNARPRAGLRTRAGDLNLVAIEFKSSRRTGARHYCRGISGAAVLSQRLSLPARHPGGLEVLAPKAAAARAGGDRHCRDRFYCGAGPDRHHSQVSCRRHRFCHRPARVHPRAGRHDAVRYQCAVGSGSSVS